MMLSQPHRLAGRDSARCSSGPCRQGRVCLQPRHVRPLQHGRGFLVCSAAAPRSLYDVLGVPQSANAKAIKAAYRGKALKLHPDVNKAPDAQEKFVEAKTAFETLNDADRRAEYDRALRLGFFDGNGRASSGFGASSSGRTRPQPQDDFDLGNVMQELADSLAGLAEQLRWDSISRGATSFVRDLEREVSDWRRERSGGGKAKEGDAVGGTGAKKKDDRLPKTLWEELDEIGEDVYGLADEFVSFLEQTAGIEAEQEARRGGRSGSSSGKGADPSAGANGRDAAAGGTAGSSSSSSSSSNGSSRSSSTSPQSSARDTGYTPPPPPPPPPRPAAPPPPPPKKTLDDEVEDMLAALKKKLKQQP